MKKIIAFCLLSLYQQSSIAGPWIDANQVFLRADIQLLADKGIINAPINHWPIMWSDIAQDIQDIDIELLPEAYRTSVLRLNFYYKKAQKSSSKTALFIANETPKFKRFGDSHLEKGEASISREFIGDSWAVKLQTTHVVDALDDKSFRLDGSYIAYKLGNWNLTAGAVQRWWGPGWDTAIIQSNNARPVPGLSLNRINSNAFETPWLSWLGTWNFTSFMGQLEDKGRAVPKTLLWQNRLSLKPFKQFEIAFSRATQWGGDGRDNSLSAFWDMLSPSESDNKLANDENDRDTNDLGSIDLRFNTSNFGVYYQMGFEDYGISTAAPSKRSHLAGIDTEVFTDSGIVNLFIEALDTYHDECACIYKHDIYESGYTYRKRIIGSTYGTNAQSVTLGMLTQFNNGDEWKVYATYVEQNKDKEGTYIPRDSDFNESGKYVGNNYVETMELNSKYRFVIGKSRWELGGLIRFNSYDGNVDFDDKDQDVEVSVGYEYLW